MASELAKAGLSEAEVLASLEEDEEEEEAEVRTLGGGGPV